MEMALTGEPISADQAHKWGLVTQLTEPGDALERGLALASVIAANPPVAVRATQRAMIACASDESVGWQISEQAMAEAMSSEDNKEGLAAFIEKRTPIWTGR
jgi:enoyl-CoA hydratase